MAAIAPAPARAYEDQVTLDAELGYAHALSEATPPHGVALGLGSSFGLSDLFSLRGQLTAAQHPGEPSLSVFLVSAELVYLIDVFEFVPYFGLGLDGIGTWAPDVAFGSELGAHPVFGIDWLLSRSWAIGLALRPIFLVTALADDPVYFKAGLTLSYLIDPF